ncbi:MAG: MOSC N-terminal beta barrel domain-containing protein [Gemmatimonadales bacterium]
MPTAKHPASGSVVSLWRYPVKSMMGEELNATAITERGLVWDRAYAIIDRANGKVASAKNPKKWPKMFDFRANVIDSPHAASATPRLRIVLPDGTTVTSDMENLDEILSRAFDRDVTLSGARDGTVNAEAYWPDIEGLEQRDTVTEFTLPEDTFFDAAVVNLLTTATLDCLRTLYPQGRFETRRFRPNIVVQPDSGGNSFVENEWIGHTITIGDGVRLSITRACQRCVMTTLPQGDLPRDHGILRTIARFNHTNAGVYAAVIRGGTIRRGDSVKIE